jgi:hypothetical protein
MWGCALIVTVTMIGHPAVEACTQLVLRDELHVLT